MDLLMERTEKDEILVVDKNYEFGWEFLSLSIHGKQSPSETVNIVTYFNEFKDSIEKTFDDKLNFANKKTVTSISKYQNPQLNRMMIKSLEKKALVTKLNGKLEMEPLGAEKLNMLIYKKLPDEGIKNLRSLQDLESQKGCKSTHFKDKYWTMPPGSQNGAIDLEPLKDIVLTIRVYKPIDKSQVKARHNFKPNVKQEVEILGSQTLDKLRDVITCPNDYVKNWNFVEYTNGDQVPYAKDIYKSGFFYFGDTFYNDMRDPNNIDYSEPIRTWTSETNAYQHKDTAKMEDTKFSELSVQFGFPYVYQHQGSCEHIIVFVASRLLNTPDELRSSCYPMFHLPYKHTNINCIMCGVFPAVWLTLDNPRIPHEPGLFCAECYLSYNYDSNNRKVEDFFSHPFYQDKPLDESELYDNQSSQDSPRYNKRRGQQEVHEFPNRLFASQDLLSPLGNPSNSGKSKNKTCKTKTVSHDTIIDETLRRDMQVESDLTSTTATSNPKKSIPSAEAVQDKAAFSKTYTHSRKKLKNGPKSLAQATGYEVPVVYDSDITDDEIPMKRSYKRKQKKGEVQILCGDDKKSQEDKISKDFYQHLEQSLSSLPPFKVRTYSYKRKNNKSNTSEKCQSKTCKLRIKNTTKKSEKSSKRSSTVVTRSIKQSVSPVISEVELSEDETTPSDDVICKCILTQERQKRGAASNVTEENVQKLPKATASTVANTANTTGATSTSVQKIKKITKTVTPRTVNVKETRTIIKAPGTESNELITGDIYCDEEIIQNQVEESSLNIEGSEIFELSQKVTEKSVNSVVIEISAGTSSQSNVCDIDVKQINTLLPRVHPQEIQSSDSTKSGLKKFVAKVVNGQTYLFPIKPGFNISSLKNVHIAEISSTSEPSTNVVASKQEPAEESSNISSLKNVHIAEISSTSEPSTNVVASKQEPAEESSASDTRSNNNNNSGSNK